VNSIEKSIAIDFKILVLYLVLLAEKSLLTRNKSYEMPGVSHYFDYTKATKLRGWHSRS